MVFRKISKDIKLRAIWLWDHGWATEDIQEVLDVSERSVRRWRKIFEQHGDPVNPPSFRQGRPPTLHGVALQDLLLHVGANPWLFLDEIQEWITLHYDLAISRSRIHEVLRDCGMSLKLMRRAAAERDEDKRREFRERLQAEGITSRHLVTVDESSKDDRTIYRHFGRSMSGQRAEIDAVFQRGVRFTILPAMTIDGYIATRIVEGSVDMTTFISFIIDDVLPLMNRFPEPYSVLLLDNCPIHKSNALEEAVVAYGCKVVFLPPYSPDMMPIEYSFSTLKAWIRRHYNRLVECDDPEQQLRDACSAITADLAKNWFTSCGYD